MKRVIDFDQSAEYFYRRFKAYKDEDSPEQAFASLSLALSKAPDEPKYLLAMAEEVIESEAYSYALYLITRALLYGAEPKRALVSIAYLFAGRGRIPRCKAVLGACGNDMRKSRLETSLELFESLKPDDRKLRRKLRFDLMSQQALADERPEAALRYCLKALKLGPHSGQSHSQAALAYAACDDEANALFELTQARKYMTFGENPLCVCLEARTLLTLGRDEEARALLNETAPIDYSPELVNDYFDLLSRCELDAVINKCAKAYLEESPRNETLLHALSLSAAITGKPEESCVSGWKRILARDPGCISAADYLNAYENGTLSEDYSYLLVPRSCDASKLLTEFTKKNGDEFIDTALRLLAEGGTGAKFALNMLASKPSEKAARLLMIASVHPSFEPGLRAEARSVMMLMGIKPDYSGLEPLKEACKEGFDEIRCTLSARDVPIVDDVADMNCDPNLTAQTFRKFASYKRSEKLLINADAVCAALYCTVRRLRGKHVEMQKVLKEYKLRPRQLRRALNMMCRANGIQEVEINV